MIRGVLVRTLGDFSEEPRELSRQVGDVQQFMLNGISAALDKAAAIPTPSMRKTTSSAYQPIKLRELATVDSSNGNVLLDMPSPAQPEWLAIIRTSASNTVTLRCVGTNGSGKVMGAASYTLPATVGLTIWMCDGTGWWGTV